jgi:lipoate---protein ligase
MKPVLNLLQLNQYPIMKQLQLEEAILRTDQNNWCLINDGSHPAIVMGISGKPELLLNHTLLKQQPIPIIRRFSGGGTVFVDEHTLFVTFICNSSSFQIPCCPQKVSKWTEHFFQPVFPNLDFKLIENDYVLGNKKFGGNAQYLRKDRWLHHSSLLWDFSHRNMKYLLKPPKMPQYRQERDHHDFLCRLKDFHTDKKSLKLKITQALESNFHIQEILPEEALEILKNPHRKATTVHI